MQAIIDRCVASGTQKKLTPIVKEESMKTTPRKPRFEFIGLELHVAGCTNICRHCKDAGSPPHGELMRLNEVKWVVEQFRELTQSNPSIVKGL